MEKLTLSLKHYVSFRESAHTKYGDVSLVELFYIFQCFKHQFSIVELNQNQLMDEVNLHG